jgi:hypothetical protein
MLHAHMHTCILHFYNHCLHASACTSWNMRTNIKIHTYAQHTRCTQMYKIKTRFFSAIFTLQRKILGNLLPSPSSCSHVHALLRDACMVSLVHDCLSRSWPGAYLACMTWSVHEIKFWLQRLIHIINLFVLFLFHWSRNRCSTEPWARVSR